MIRKKVVVEYIPHMNEGGAEALVRDYALMLNKEKFDVLVVTNNIPNEASSNVKVLRDRGATLLALKKHKWFFKIPFVERVWNHFFLEKQIHESLHYIVVTYKVDVIHVHLELLKYILPIVRKYPHIKVIYTCHNEPQIHLSPFTKVEEYNAARSLFEKRGNCMIALHEKMKYELEEMFPSAVVKVVRNGIQLDRFRNVTEATAEIRDSLGIPQNAFVLGHIGRFSEAKNHMFLVDIFKRVKEKNSQAYLLLVGSGPLYENVVNQISEYGLSESVMILSNRYDIPALLKCMDVFVFPSIFEGLPVTLVESQAVGIRSVISTNVTSECFFSEKAVPLSLELKAEDWADVILDMSIKGSYSNCIEEYDMSHVVQVLEEIYLS